MSSVLNVVFFAEKAVFLQTAQLGDGIFQFPGIFLDIHSITLGGLVGDGHVFCQLFFSMKN